VDDDPEPPEHRPIEQLRVVGRSDDHAGRRVLLEELEEGVEHSADLANVVGAGAVSCQRIDLVEEVDAAGLIRCIEDQPKLGCSLAHELRDQGSSRITMAAEQAAKQAILSKAPRVSTAALVAALEERRHSTTDVG
jgi:hypothetical protein